MEKLQTMNSSHSNARTTKLKTKRQKKYILSLHLINRVKMIAPPTYKQNIKI